MNCTVAGMRWQYLILYFLKFWFSHPTFVVHFQWNLTSIVTLFVNIILSQFSFCLVSTCNALIYTLHIKFTMHRDRLYDVVVLEQTTCFQIDINCQFIVGNKCGINSSGICKHLQMFCLAHSFSPNFSLYECRCFRIAAVMLFEGQKWAVNLMKHKLLQGIDWINWLLLLQS